jgi:hypothetical protein
MNIQDGLTHYQVTTNYYRWALALEKQGLCVLELLKEHVGTPPLSALIEVRQFLIEVEKWKAGCLQQRMGNVAKNSDSEIWNAIFAATKTSNDVERLKAIMKLKGFGSSRDEITGQRRAKVATSVLRFLWPEKWGVVDWRVASMLGCLGKHNWDVDKAITEAKQSKARDFRNTFDIIDEQGAVEYIKQYRALSEQHSINLPRPADIDMAIFGLSLFAWPMP